MEVSTFMTTTHSTTKSSTFTSSITPTQEIPTIIPTTHKRFTTVETSSMSTVASSRVSQSHQEEACYEYSWSNLVCPKNGGACDLNMEFSCSCSLCFK